MTHDPSRTRREARIVRDERHDEGEPAPPVPGSRFSLTRAARTRPNPGPWAMTEQRMERLRILVVDDHEVVRLGVRALLESHPGWQVCAEATDGRDAVEKATSLSPDVVILGLEMPGLNGIDATRQIRQRSPGTEVLVLTADVSGQRAREALEAGALGYLLKSDAARDIAHAVGLVAQHKSYVSSSIADAISDSALSPPPPHKRPDRVGALTGREREIVQLLAEGKTAKEVASILSISRKTVETHRANVARKLHLRGLCDLIRYAIRNGLTKV